MNELIASDQAIRILVVDDESLIREILRQALNMEGYEVVTAANGKEAMKLFNAEKFDLVITDLMMPEKEGIETIQEMKLLAPDLKIIAMSGRQGIGNFLNVAKYLGASAILAKPFEHSVLSETIREVLGKD